MAVTGRGGETFGLFVRTDDDRNLNTLLAETLRSANFEVTAAENIDEAIAAVATSRPDLAVLDIKMQGASGLDLGAVLRDDFGVPFVFLSLMDDEQTVRKASEVGAIAYLVKPLDMRQCLPTIEAAFARAEELQRLRETESQLSIALQQSREISMAIGLLMERLRIDRDTAFERLRDEARARRRRMSEVAEEVLQSVELINSFASGQGATRLRRMA
jgi:two-component system, response regulator PdtaR